MSSSPAVWSAIAASFSSLTAFLLLLTQIRNARDSVRPEVILEDWTLGDDEEGWGYIDIKRVKNYGRGPALNLEGEAKGWPGGRTEKESNVVHQPVLVHTLPPGEGQNVGWRIRFQWPRGLPATANPKIAVFRVTLGYFDLHGRLYLVNEKIVASNPHCVGGPYLNDGLTLIFRHVSASWLGPRLWGWVYFMRGGAATFCCRAKNSRMGQIIREKTVDSSVWPILRHLASEIRDGWNRKKQRGRELQ